MIDREVENQQLAELIKTVDRQNDELLAVRREMRRRDYRSFIIGSCSLLVIVVMIATTYIITTNSRRDSEAVARIFCDSMYAHSDPNPAATTLRGQDLLRIDTRTYNILNRIAKCPTPPRQEVDVTP